MSSLQERVEELERRVARMIQTGEVVAADYDAARVQVRIDSEDGSRYSPFLPWATRRAGGDVDWWAPEVGEQVEIMAPNGDINAARVVPAFYSDAVPAPANTPDIRLIRFGNGTEIIHDRAQDQLTIKTPDSVDLMAEGDLVADIGGTADITAAKPATVKAPKVTIDTPTAEFTGEVIVAQTLTAGTDVIAAGISLTKHIHPGDSGGTTGGPQ